jgi:hypothetical protein
MTITKYTYNKLCDSNRLSAEIKDSPIVIAEDRIETSSLGITDVYMKAALSNEEETTLNALVTAHVNTPLPDDVVINVNVESQPAVTISSAPAFQAKTLVINGVTKKLFARNIGFDYALSAGTNTITYSIPYPWLKMLGMEVVNCEALDKVNFKVFDNSLGTYSGVPNLLLNQFAFNLNLPKDYYSRESRFDADIYYGMVLSIEYNSISAKTIGINLAANEVKD